jgi:hypothetical protein
MNKYRNIPDKDLLELLIIYTDEYTQLLREEKNFLICKQLVDEITNELQARKEVPAEVKPPLQSIA